MSRALLILSAGFVAGAAVIAPQGKTQAHSSQALSLFDKNCSSCHVRPDSRFKTDRAWIERISGTTWTGTPESVRAALKTDLAKDKAHRPRLVSAKAKRGESAIKTDVGQTAILLLDAHKHPLRLSWDSAKQTGESRPLAPGEYTIVGFRQSKKDKTGKEWMLTASGANLGKIRIQQGKTLNYKFPKAIDLKQGLSVSNGIARTSMGLFFGAGGVTIYRDAKRIPMPFELLDARGEVVGSGSMEYGWGGGGSAAVRLKKNLHGDVKLKLGIPEDIPFSIKMH